MIHPSRKAFLTLSGTALAAFATAACGAPATTPTASAGASVDGKGKTLSVLLSVNATYPDQQKQWMAALSATFKAQTGADLTFETFASGAEELTKIQTSVVAGRGPDVYGLGTTFTPTAYATGAFMKLTDADWAAIGGKNRFNPAALGISGPDDKNLIGIPYTRPPLVMAYNTELLKSAGIDAPATSWNGLRDQAKKSMATTPGTFGLSIGYKDGYDPWKYVWGLAIQTGNTLVNGSKATINDPVVKKAYETYFGWYGTDKIVDPAAAGWTNPQALAAFSQGKTAFLPMTTSRSMPTLDASPVAGKYAFAVMPTTVDGTTPSGAVAASGILAGDNLVIADYSSVKDLALAFVNLATSKEEQLTYTKTFGDLPANVEALKALADPRLAPMAQAASQAHATPFTGAWSDIQLALMNVVVQSLPELSSGGVRSSSLDKLLADAQQKSQSSLDRVPKG